MLDFTLAAVAIPPKLFCSGNFIGCFFENGTIIRVNDFNFEFRNLGEDVYPPITVSLSVLNFLFNRIFICGWCNSSYRSNGIHVLKRRTKFQQISTDNKEMLL